MTNAAIAGAYLKGYFFSLGEELKAFHTDAKNI